MALASRIGIQAPFTFDVTTYAACGLADLAVRWGLAVSYRAYQAVAAAVHPRWHQHVLHGRRCPLGPWAARCSHLVWFDVQPERLVEAGAGRQLAVVAWHRLRAPELEALQLFDHVICPHRAAYRWVADRGIHQALCVPWDPGRQPAEDVLHFGGRRLAVIFDGPAGEELGGTVLCLLRLLLESRPQATVTILYSRRWPVQAQPALRDLGAFGDRVRLERNPDYHARLSSYATHDWVILPATRANYGLYALEARAARRPVLALDVPPYDEIICSGETGLLVPCKIRYNEWGVPEAALNAHAFLEHLQYAVDHPELCERARQHPAQGLRDRRREFERAWQTLWEVRDEP